MSIRTHNRRFRRLALERVEDRKMLAPVAFATGMDNQLSALTSNAASDGTLPLPALVQSSIAGAGPSNGSFAIINGAASSGSYVFSPANAADITFGPSGGNQPLVIGSSDLPPARQPILPITFPTGPQGPIDIGPIVGNPYGPITGPRPSQPVVAGSPGSSPAPGAAQQSGVTATPSNDPTASIAQPIALPKPAVEGNGGRSQVIDVAVSTGDGPATASAVVSYATPGTQVMAQAAAMPTPAGVDAVMRSIARSNSAIVSPATGQATARPTTEAARIAADRLATSDVAAREGQSQGRSDATADVGFAPEVAIAIPAASSAEADASVNVSSGASNIKRGAAAIQPLVAGIYQRVDVFGAAAVAFAGHYAMRRWRKGEADQPRPIISWRKKAARLYL